MIKTVLTLCYLMISISFFAQNIKSDEQIAFDYYKTSILKPMPNYNKIFVNNKLKENNYSEWNLKFLKQNKINLSDTIHFYKSTIKEIEVLGNKKFVVTKNLQNKFPNIEVSLACRFTEKKVVIINENYEQNSKKIYILLDNNSVVLQSYIEEIVEETE